MLCCYKLIISNNLDLLNRKSNGPLKKYRKLFFSLTNFIHSFIHSFLIYETESYIIISKTNDYICKYICFKIIRTHKLSFHTDD